MAKAVIKPEQIPSAFNRVVAVIVGIENYQTRSSGVLPTVEYAHDDAKEFADVLSQIYGPEQLECDVLLDQNATCTGLHDKLGYLIKNLEKDDLFVFYYAGHGFHGVGGNRITAFDTNAFNIPGTTLLLSDLLNQLDYYPTAGSSPIAYALADRGARLLIQRDGIEFANVEWSRKNRKAGRPFIEHQLEIVDFSVALQLATAARRDVRFIHPNDIIAAFPEETRAARNPLSLRVKLSHQGAAHEIGLVPDLVFGLQFASGSRHSFMVEIDRGTMPIARSDFLQTSFERKMRAYLTAHAGKQHEKHFGWKTFRVLTVTTDHYRMQSMMEALRKLRIPHSPGAPLFFFTTRDELRASDPLMHEWRDGNGRAVGLI